jgi:hypothetical protein
LQAELRTFRCCLPDAVLRVVASSGICLPSAQDRRTVSAATGSLPLPAATCHRRRSRANDDRKNSYQKIRPDSALHGVFTPLERATCLPIHEQPRRTILSGLAGATAIAAAGLPAGAAEGGNVDYQAMVDRASTAIDAMRKYYICEGWHGAGLDEPGAERMLVYLRACAAAGQDIEDEDGWRATTKFVREHGLSLDWLIDGDVDALITRLAARSPRGAMLPQEGDPIFALIATHRATIDEIERQAGGDLHLDPTKEAYEAESAAVRALLRATPTTPAGAIAMLRHLDGAFAAGYGSPPFADYPGALADAGETLFGRLATVLAGTGEAQS